MSAGAIAGESPGLVDTSTGNWHLFDEDWGRSSFVFGNPGDAPIVGDWNGMGGAETPGLFRSSDGFFYGRNSNTTGNAHFSCFAGNASDVALAGDWNGDGTDNLGIYRPSEQKFYLYDKACVGNPGPGMGAAESEFLFGNPGDTPVAGDFDGDGKDEVGLYRESTGFLYWRNTLTTGNADGQQFFGDPGDRFIAGDWGTVDGIDSPGVYRQGDTSFYLRYSLTPGFADEVVSVGQSTFVPVAGEFGDLGSTVPLIDLAPMGSFASPVFLNAPPDDDRVFILEREGRIKVVDGGSSTTFLDVTALTSDFGERGLLGLAFHADYASNGRFWIYHNDISGTSIVAEYTVSANPNVADAGSRARVLGLVQTSWTQNGGTIAFGPDGYLYFGPGDGGSSGDPFGVGQDPNWLLGSMVRIDVSSPGTYSIPPTNPYVGGGGKPEVWANGLRNPFRFSFDGDYLYIGDVGEDSWEEIDVVDATAFPPLGYNFGWSIMEGAHCYSSSGCNTAGLTLPLIEYASAGGNCWVTGGYVYRGAALAGLSGHYFYADYCLGRIKSFKLVDGKATEHWDYTAELGTVSQLVSFGTDGHGELYVVSDGGPVYKVVAG